jgi:ribosome biogenesis GTPase A
MLIQWYPGHMHKASKEIKEILPQVDLIIEILDARIPFSSQNPMLAGLRGDKPCIKVLSKSDLADPEITLQWQDYLEREQGVKTLALTTEQPEKTRQLIDLCHKMLPNKASSDKPIHTLIMGIPNVGKSTLMNALVKKKVAAVGDQPAVTKSQQRIDISSRLTIYDTPGMLWPKIEHPIDGLMLAASHAVGVNAYIDEEVATFLADFLVEHYPALLTARYGFSTAGLDGVSVIEAVAKKRGCLMKGRGGELDLEKAAGILLTDYRTAAIGRISLETPALREARAAQLLAKAAAAVDTAED